jgi:hypothetical protein
MSDGLENNYSCRKHTLYAQVETLTYEALPGTKIGAPAALQ